jgi:hypothetical protein
LATITKLGDRRLLLLVGIKNLSKKGTLAIKDIKEIILIVLKPRWLKINVKPPAKYNTINNTDMCITLMAGEDSIKKNKEDADKSMISTPENNVL